MKLNVDEIKDKLTTIFLVLFFFAMLFGFNEEHLSDSIVYKNIVIPYFNLNITYFLCIISIITITFFIILKNVKIDKIFILLLIRIVLYCLPIIYITGDYKIGIFYAMIQCLFSYFIGRNSSKGIESLVKILICYSLAICMEIFYVLIVNKISCFSSELKWYMILPMGRNNYLTCILLPIYALAVNYFSEHKLKIAVYSIIMFFAILSTGSRLALIIFLVFVVYNFYLKSVIAKQISKKQKFSLFLKITIFSLCIVMIAIKYSDKVSAVTDRFTVNNIFEGRMLVYKDVFKYIYNNPILGRSAYSYRAYDATKAHNFILESLVQTGLIGTIVYIYILYLVIKRTQLIQNIKARKAITSFLVIYLCQGLIEPNLFGTASDAYFWLIIGIFVLISNNTVLDDNKMKIGSDNVDRKNA